MKKSTRMRIYRWARLWGSGGVILISTEWDKLKADEAKQRRIEGSKWCAIDEDDTEYDDG